MGAQQIEEGPRGASSERDAIAKALRETWWNKLQAAKRLALSRKQLYFRMRKYALEDPPSLQT